MRSFARAIHWLLDSSWRYYVRLGPWTASPFVSIPMRMLPSAPGHFWEQFILPGYVRGGLLSLCNTGPLALKRQIVCIHDLNSRITPESYGLMFRAVYRVLVPALGHRAARIVTVSRFSQKTLGQFGIAASRRDRGDSRRL